MVGPGDWSLDHAVDIDWHGWTGAVIAAVAGLGGAAGSTGHLLPPEEGNA